MCRKTEDAEIDEGNYIKGISFLTEMLQMEKEKAAGILNEIKSLEQEEYNLKRTKEKASEKKDPNYSLFSPLSFNESDQFEQKFQESLSFIGTRLDELRNYYNSTNEKIECFMLLKKCISKNKTKDVQSEEIGIQILETQEVERSRIARDLHDSTVQSLANLVHKTELCTKLLDVDVIRVKLELLTMTNSIRTVINDMRDTIYNLRPMSLNDLGLFITVERYLTRLKEYNNIQTILKTSSVEREVSSIVNITLFRIIQEACNNIVKHAAANAIVVILDYDADNINIEISDNGKGFNYDNMKEDSDRKEGHQLGLSIMRERVYLLSGQLSIDTHPGKGTKIVIRVPLGMSNDAKASQLMSNDTEASQLIDKGEDNESG